MPIQRIIFCVNPLLLPPDRNRLADMAKLADAPDLGSGAARRVGSTPIIRTDYN